VAVIVRNLASVPADWLDGAVSRLRATSTGETVACMDAHGVWPLVATATDKDAMSVYGSEQHARAEFVRFADRNTALHPCGEAEHAAAIRKAEAMLAGTGVRVSPSELETNLMPWRRMIRRIAGLPRARTATYPSHADGRARARRGHAWRRPSRRARSPA